MKTIIGKKNKLKNNEYKVCYSISDFLPIDIESKEFLLIKMRDEGFDYYFRHYSSWDAIKDEGFHMLRANYLAAVKLFEDYITNMPIIDDEIYPGD